MRSTLSAARAVVALGLVLAVTSCTTDEPSFSENSSLGSLACPVTITRVGPKVISADANTSGNNASWFLVNSSPSDVPITARSCVKTGNITTCVANAFGTYVPANSQIDGDVTFATGNPGGGSVALRVTLTGCGQVTAPAFLVDIN